MLEFVQIAIYGDSSNKFKFNIHPTKPTDI